MEKAKFNWHRWSATNCGSVDQVLQLFNQMEISGKTIDTVHVIGTVESIIDPGCWLKMLKKLRAQGISDKAIFSGNCKQLNDLPVPQELTICEPVIVYFTDGSSIELLCGLGYMIKVGFNQIPKWLTDGTNDCNLQADSYFEHLHGQTIKGIRYLHVRREHPFREQRQRDLTCGTWLLETESGDALYIQNTGCDGFQVGVGKPHTDDLGPLHIESILYGKAKSLTKELNQVFIREGSGAGSSFWIFPMRQNGTYRGDVCTEEEISIDETVISNYLWYFLDKYFDQDFPYDCRDQGAGPGFEWNLEHNIYRYETMDRLLLDIEECCSLLKSDFNSARIQMFRHSCCKSCLDNDCAKEIRNAHENDEIQERLTVLYDFYTRFVQRIRDMMRHAPEYGLISFMGP